MLHILCCFAFKFLFFAYAFPLTFTLALPWKLVSPALAVVALVLGALVWSGSRGVDRSGSSRAAAGAGSALALVGLTVGLLPALLWNETAAFERCTG